MIPLLVSVNAKPALLMPNWPEPCTVLPTSITRVPPLVLKTRLLGLSDKFNVPPPLKVRVPPPVLRIRSVKLPAELSEMVPAFRMSVPVTVKLLPSLTTRPLPPASCRLATDPLPVRVTVLVPSMMQAFAEELGVPLVQFPGTVQEPLASLQVVEGPPKLPHWDRAGPAAKERHSRSKNREGMAQDALPDKPRRRTTKLPLAAKAEFCTAPPRRLRMSKRQIPRT